MTRHKVCARCGDSSATHSFVGAFCEKCFQETHEPAKVPKDLEVDLCVHCGRVRLLGAWVPYTGKTVSGWIQNKVKHSHPLVKASASVTQDRHGLEADLHYVYKVHGKELPWKGRVRVLIRKTQCPDDAKQASGYYQAIIQLRGSEEAVDNAAEALVNAIEGNYTYIAKSVAQKQGVDLYVGDKTKLQRTFEELRVRFEASRKLMGQREGKDLYLTTYLIRV